MYLFIKTRQIYHTHKDAGIKAYGFAKLVDKYVSFIKTRQIYHTHKDAELIKERNT